MRRDLISSAIAVVVLTLVLGIAYPLLTGVSQVAFPGNANGSKLMVNGKVVGSKLLAQDFTRPVLGANGKPKMDADGNPVTEPDPKYFQPRPSATGWSASATFFANQGPEPEVDARLPQAAAGRLPCPRAPVRPRPDGARRSRSTP